MGLETVVDGVSSNTGQAPFHASTKAQGLGLLKKSIDVLNSGSISWFVHLQGRIEVFMVSSQSNETHHELEKSGLCRIVNTDQKFTPLHHTLVAAYFRQYISSSV